MLLLMADVQELCQVMFKASGSLESAHPKRGCTRGLGSCMRLGWGTLQMSWPCCSPGQAPALRSTTFCRQ